MVAYCVCTVHNMLHKGAHYAGSAMWVYSAYSDEISRFVTFHLDLHCLPKYRFTNFQLFSVSDEFCRLLLIFANSLDLEQARQNVEPDLDPVCLLL